MKNILPLPNPLKKEIQNSMDKIFPSNLPSPNLYRIVAKNEALFQELVESKFIGPTGLFDRGRISPIIREKIILRTCVASNNRYEFALHEETISEKMGLTKTQIEDIKNPITNSEYWAKEDVALFDLIDSLVKKIAVDNSVFDDVAYYYEEAQIIEIIHIIGFYTAVAMLVAFCKPELDNYKNLINEKGSSHT